MHFTNFSFSHFEIQENFGLIWVKLQDGRFLMQIFILGIKKVLASSMGFIFLLILCITEILDKFGEKLQNGSLELKNFDFGSRFPNYGVPFCSF